MSIWVTGKKVGEHFPSTIEGVGLFFQLRDEPLFIKYRFSACNKFLHHFRDFVLSAGGNVLSGICCAQGIVLLYTADDFFYFIFNLIDF